jgi:hypothetical protein
MKQLSLRRIAAGVGCAALLIGAWHGAALRKSPGATQPGTAEVVSLKEGGRENRASASRASTPVISVAPTARPQPDLRVKRCQDDIAASMKERTTELTHTGTARDLAVAALFDVDMTADADVLAGMARQSKRLAVLAKNNPHDRLLVWLSALQCRREVQCDERAAVEQALRADADNMAVWLLAVERAMARDDETEADTMLQQAAKAPRMDFYWREQGLLVTDAFSGLKVPSCESVRQQMGQAVDVDGPVGPEEIVAIFATASAVAMAMPLGATRLCPARGSIPTTRLPACRTIFARMAEGDEIVTQAIGISRMSAWAQTPSERVTWRERYRNHLWLQQESRKLSRPGHARMMLEHGEIPFLTAMLEEQGRWPAPAGWLPEDHVLRARLEGSP